MLYLAETRGVECARHHEWVSINLLDRHPFCRVHGEESQYQRCGIVSWALKRDMKTPTELWSGYEIPWVVVLEVIACVRGEFWATLRGFVPGCVCVL
jgi:hypothetical protein